jgi:hypothetical protein
MRVGDFELGEGKVYALESVRELSELRPRLRKLVPPQMVRLAEGFPGTFRDLAGQMSSKSVAAWLRAAAKSRAAIVAYDPIDFAPKAFLELDFGLRPTAGGDLPWIVLVDCVTGAPERCPAALRAIYASLGGIQTQYGASGTLISPSEVRPLSKLRPEAPHLFEMDLIGAGVRPADWFAYFECDGDYLCYRADGRSRWFGMEWGSSSRLISTRRCVDDLFESLRAKRYFNASEQLRARE